MLLTIVITKNEIQTLVKRRNDSAVIKHSKAGDNISACVNEAIKQGMSKGWKAAKPIPTAIILPLDSSGWKSKVDSFKKKNANDVRVVFEDILANSYLKGSGKDITNSDYVILSNHGDGNELFFYKSDGNSQVSLLPEMNTENGLKKLNDHVIAAFAKEGLMLGADQEKQLLEQIRKGGKGGNYKIQKKSGHITIDASINVSKTDYEDKVSEKKSLLSKHLHPKILQASPNLKEVIMVGDYFDNQVLQTYLKNELQLGSFIKKDSYTTLDKLVNNASVVGFGGIEKFMVAESAEADRIAGLKRKREAKHARESLLLEIRQTVVDPAKVDEYKSVFAKKAENLGIPKEVVMWNIDEIVDTLELEQELGKKNEIPVISTSNIEKITTTTTNLNITSSAPKASPKPSSVKVEKAVPAAAKVQKSAAAATKKATVGASMEKIFKTKQKLNGIGFGAAIGELVNQPGNEKVLRFISNNELNNSSAKSSFENLHAKESGYYEDMSPIHNGPDGKYYFRDSLEGEPLPTYVKKNASRFGANIDKWSNNDLKLVLKIWKEIDALDYKYDINAEDVIILSKLTWSLKREMDIKLVNFNAKEVSKKQMEDKMHKVLSQVFTKKTYQNLRKKFSV